MRRLAAAALALACLAFAARPAHAQAVTNPTADYPLTLKSPANKTSETDPNTLFVTAPVAVNTPTAFWGVAYTGPITVPVPWPPYLVVDVYQSVLISGDGGQTWTKFYTLDTTSGLAIWECSLTFSGPAPGTPGVMFCLQSALYGATSAPVTVWVPVQ